MCVYACVYIYIYIYIYIYSKVPCRLTALILPVPSLLSVMPLRSLSINPIISPLTVNIRMPPTIPISPTFQFDRFSVLELPASLHW